MRTQQSGFTLVELIMVIVIIGILAAAALPRFADLQGDARFAKAQAIFGTVRSATNISHAMALTRGNNNVVLEGTAISMLNNYPMANATGIVAAAGISTGPDSITLGNPDASTITIDMNGATTGNCRVTYIQTGDPNTAPTVTLTGTAAACNT